MADLTYLPGRIISPIETLIGMYTDYYRSRGYYLYGFDPDDMVPSLQFDGILSMDVIAEGQVVSCPVEKGSFAAYNKTQQPIEIRALMAFEGDDSKLQRAVDTLIQMRDATNILSFITPQQEYASMNLQSFSYAMQPETGLNVLFAEIRLIEIREVEPQYTDAKANSPITQKSAKNMTDVSTQEMGKKTTGIESSRSFLRDGYGAITNEGQRSLSDVGKDVAKKLTGYSDSLLKTASN